MKKTVMKTYDLIIRKRKYENKLNFISTKLKKILKYYKYKQKNKGLILKYLIITFNHKGKYDTEYFPLDLKITHKKVMLFILDYLEQKIEFLNTRYQTFDLNQLWLNGITFRFFYENKNTTEGQGK